MTTIAVITLLPLIFAAALFQLMPLITRQGIFFGATVDPEFPRSADGRRLLRSYRLQAAVWAVLALALAFVLATRPPGLATLTPNLLMVIGSSLSYWLKFREIHAKYGQRRPEIRQAELTPQSTSESIHAWVWIPPFVAMALTGAFLQSRWSDLPVRFPVHWGAGGQADRWATREPLTVFAPLLIGAGMNLFLLAIAWMFSHLPRNTVMRRVTVRLLEVLLYPLTFTFIVVALLPLGLVVPVWVIPGFMLACVAGLIYWSYRQIAAPALADAVPEPQSDAFWKAGMFYYNPNDPAVFVAKRVGVGYTLNFASKWAWIVMAFTIAIIVGSLTMVRPAR